jgi:hypothetical protein
MRGGIGLGVVLMLGFGLVGCGRQARSSKPPPPSYLRVRYLPAAEPSLYVEFRNREVRVATSPKALAAAKPVRAAHAQEVGGLGFSALADEEWAFPPVALPGAPPGTKAKATFTYLFTPSSEPSAVDPGTVTGDVELTAPDAQGRNWVYRGSWDESTEESPEASACVDVPSPRGLQLAVEARPEGRDVAVVVSLLTSVGQALEEVESPNGAKPVLVEVWDEAGKRIHSHRGVLTDFEDT